MVQIRDLREDRDIRIETNPGGVRMRVYTRLLRIFIGVKEPRVKGRTTYRLDHLILMIFLSVLSGADSYQEMHLFWELRMRLYRRIFPMYGGSVPSHDCFRHILGLLEPSELNRAMVRVLSDSYAPLRKALKLPAPRYVHLCVDGKQLRGTGRALTDGGTSVKDLQSLNVYDNTSDICLFSSAIETKTNEIPTAQAVLGKMRLKGTVVTFDAMNTQKETVRVITSKKGDYVGGLKGNHGALLAKAEGLFTKERTEAMRAEAGDYLKTSEISHNQLEEREFYMVRLTPSQRKGDFAGWEGIRSVVRYSKTCTGNIDGKVGREVRHYISSLTDVEMNAAVIRGHWGVENRLHNGLDTVFMEDYISDADRNAAMNRDAVCKACLSVTRRYQDIKGFKGQISKKAIRKMFGWDTEKILSEMLTLLDPKMIEECVSVVEKKAKKPNAKGAPEPAGK